MDQKGDGMKINFEYFQIQKWMSQTVRAEKVDGKNGIICLVSMLPSRVLALKLSEKVQLLQYCADLSKKSNYIKTIYIYASERSRCALSENGTFYYVMIYWFGDIRVWNQRSLINFCWASIFFNILITNNSWTVAQIPLNHTIFWKSVMRTFRCTYGKLLSQTFTGFWLRSAQNCIKCTFLDNSRTIPRKGNIETRQMTPFFI